MRHYIIDDFSRFVDAKGNLPNLTISVVPRKKAPVFRSKQHAQETLKILVDEFGFKGRVVDEQDVREMGVGDDD